MLCSGNDNLHLLTSDKRQRLRVDLGDFEGNTAYAEYDNFTVGSAIDKYRLSSIGNYTGTAGRLWNCASLLHYSIACSYNSAVESMVLTILAGFSWSK